MLEVKLSSHSLDVETINQWRTLLGRTNNFFEGFIEDPALLDDIRRELSYEATPETVSAAAARISRDPRPIDELREEARRERKKAGRSVRNISGKLCHHSVVEHIGTTFDIKGLSRRALEYLESHRLCGYTEKSQRYINVSAGDKPVEGKDFIVPEEIRSDKKLLKEYIDLIGKQFKAYDELYSGLLNSLIERFPERKKEDLEKIAGEDARYALGLGVVSQLEFSANCRNLEYVIRTLKNSDLEESRRLGNLLYSEIEKVAPNAVILANPERARGLGIHVDDSFFKNFKGDLAEANIDFLNLSGLNLGSQRGLVSLDGYTPEPDKEVLKALILTSFSEGGKTISPFIAERLSERLLMGGEGKDYFLSFMKDLTKFDAVPREFEVVDFTYGVVMSAAAFAQWKRHRMMTLLNQPYDPSLGITIPPNVLESSDLVLTLENICGESEKVYNQMKNFGNSVAEYALTNAHRRGTYNKINARELYHISRLREDEHAQWDIRGLAEEMVDKAKKVAPLTLLLAGGKDKFDDLKRELYG